MAKFALEGSPEFFDHSPLLKNVGTVCRKTKRHASPFSASSRSSMVCFRVLWLDCNREA